MFSLNFKQHFDGGFLLLPMFLIRNIFRMIKYSYKGGKTVIQRDQQGERTPDIEVRR